MKLEVVTGTPVDPVTQFVCLVSGQVTRISNERREILGYLEHR